jgi:hypothetical protein
LAVGTHLGDDDEPEFFPVEMEGHGGAVSGDKGRSRGAPYTGRVVMVRLAGGLATLVSGLLLVIVLVRDVGLNPLNGWTIFLGFLAAGLLLGRSDGASVFAACVVLLLAMIPALIGGLGLLYLPALVLGAVGGGSQRRGDACRVTLSECTRHE